MGVARGLVYLHASQWHLTCFISGLGVFRGGPRRCGASALRDVRDIGVIWVCVVWHSSRRISFSIPQS
jgi:hypothetical protein